MAHSASSARLYRSKRPKYKAPKLTFTKAELARMDEAGGHVPVHNPWRRYPRKPKATQGVSQ